MRVATISPDVPFLKALALGLWQQAERDPLRLAEMLVLLPTRRACRELRDCFLAVTGNDASLLPRMQPLGDVDEVEFFFAAGRADDLSLTPAISSLRRQLLLTRLIRQKEAELPLEQATALADELAGLLDQVQIERADFANLEKLVPEDLAQHWQETLQFLKIITARWPDILAAENCVDPAERRNLLLNRQAALWQKKPPNYPVIAAGSTGSVPAVANLLRVIAEMPQGQVVLPGLDLALDEAAWQLIDETHPQFNMKRLLEDSFTLKRGQITVWNVINSERSARVHLLQEIMRPAQTTQAWRDLSSHTLSAAAFIGLYRMDAAHQQEEAELIALRLRAMLEQPDKTAMLVTAERSLAVRVAHLLQRWNIDVNDSAGTPLPQLPIGSFLLDVLQAAVPAAGAIEFLSLLKHPLAAAGLAKSACRQQARSVELSLWRGLRRKGGWQDVAEALTAQQHQSAAWIAGIAEYFAPFTEVWHKKLPVAEWVQQHLSLTSWLATTDETDGTEILWQGVEGEAAADWFADLRMAAHDFPPLSGDEYLGLCRSLMQRVVVRVTATHPRINIYGPLEARLMQADLVILAGLNEGSWPPEAAVDPWLSRPMQLQFGLPQPERRLGLSAHDFVQLASAPEVMLTRAQHVGHAPTVPSRFLLQLTAVLQAAGHHHVGQDPLAPALPWLEWVRNFDRPAAIMPEAAPRPCPPVSVRPTNLSVTEITVWLRNPYAIYARRILQLDELDELEQAPEASERGIALHKALELFAKQFPEELPPDALEQLCALGSAALQPYASQPQVMAFWLPRFRQAAEWLVEKWREREAGDIAFVAAEAYGKLVMDGGFTLRGRADRIDRLNDGSLSVIDYKTGKPPDKYLVKDGYEPQLALLAAMAAKGCFQDVPRAEIGELAYWQLSGGAEAGKTSDYDADIVQKLIAEALEVLENLIVAYKDPAQPYLATPKPFYRLRFNPYRQLAREAEWGEAEGDA